MHRLELGEDLREAGLDRPRAAGLQLVFRRPEDRHAERAVLPDLGARSDLQFHVVEVETRVGPVGIAVIDHAEIPGDLAGYRLDADVPVHLDAGIVGGAGDVEAGAGHVAGEIEARGPHAGIEDAAGEVVAALHRRALGRLREAAEHVLGGESDVGGVLAPLRRLGRVLHAPAHAVGERRPGQHRSRPRPQQSRPQSCGFARSFVGFPTDSPRPSNFAFFFTRAQ